MPKKTNKINKQSSFDVAARIVQLAAVIATGVVAVIELQSNGQVNWITMGILGGVAIGASPEDLPSILGLRNRGDDE